MDVLRLFEKDEKTAAVVIVEEAGGTMKEEASEPMKQGNFTKPLVTFLAGETAPPEKKLGDAGAIITGGMGTVQGKTEVLEAAGAKVAMSEAEVGKILKGISV